jgi:hypothetical protein
VDRRAGVEAAGPRHRGSLGGRKVTVALNYL